MPNWVYVGPHEMNSGNTNKSCIWAHPAKNGTLKISFPNPPPRSNIQFEHALSNNAVRSSNKSPVNVTISLDGIHMKKLSRGNRAGFTSSSFSLNSKPVKNLTLEITAKNDGARHYCFNINAKPSEAK